MRPADVRNIDAPDMIGPAARKVAQQVRLHRMVTVRAARVGLWPKSNEAHFLHLALDAFAIDGLPFTPKLLADAP